MLSNSTGMDCSLNLQSSPSRCYWTRLRFGFIDMARCTNSNDLTDRYNRQRLPSATSQAFFSWVWYVFLISLSLRIFSSARVRNISLTGFCSGMSVIDVNVIRHLNALLQEIVKTNTSHMYRRHFVHVTVTNKTNTVFAINLYLLIILMAFITKDHNKTFIQIR